jgi:hypothetical protein
MNKSTQSELKLLSPKQGGRGALHKDKPRDRVIRIRSDLYDEMTASELGRKSFNTDLDDIISEVWEFWKQRHKEKK